MDGICDWSAVDALPAAQRSAALAAALGVEARAVAGATRGLFAKRNYAIGDTILLEPAFCWLDASPEGGEPSLHFSAATPPAVRDGLLLQMAPYALTTGAERAGQPALPRKDVVMAVMQANSFGITDGDQEATGGQMSAGDSAASASASASLASASAAEDSAAALASPSRCALFSVVCLCNHSCDPNARVKQLRTRAAAWARRAGGHAHPYADGDDNDEPPVMQLEARHYIPAGSEIRISYIARTAAREDRLRLLRAVYGFTCDCPRCSVPWDDTRVARCPFSLGAGGAATGMDVLAGAARLCDGGRVYMGRSVCEDCGRRVTLSPEAEEALRSPAPLASVFDRPLPATDVAAYVLEHPYLALEDVRVFTAMNTLLSHLDPSDPRDVSLYTRVASSLALTCCTRTRYVLPQDLGIEVTEE